MRLGLGLGFGPDAERAAREAARQAKLGAPEPDLTVAFGSIHLDQKVVHRVLSSEFDASRLLGGSSYLEVSNAGVTKGTVAVLALELGSKPRLAEARVGDSRKTGRELARALAKGRSNGGKPLGLYFGSVAAGRDNETLVELRRGLGKVPVFGGMTCGDYDLGMQHPEFWTNYQYGASLTRDLARSALVALPAGSEISFAFEHGWDPVGPPFTITRAEGGTVFEVDGLPVLDYYQRLLGEDHDQSFFQLLIQRYGFAVETPQGSTVFRLPVIVDFKRKSVSLFPDEELHGRRARLILASRAGLLNGARRAAERCKAALGKKPADLVFVVSCCTRGSILNSRLGEELEAIRSVFGKDTPIFGMYSSGEVVPACPGYADAADGPSGYHATTVTMAAFSLPGAKAGPTPAPAPSPAPIELAPALKRSETTLDQAETILASLSRKSYEDSEKLRKQSEVIRRYTPHGVWTEVGAHAARGEYEIPDGEFTGAFLFMDVKGFTNFSEDHTPAQVVEALNAILKPSTETIYACGGDVDKFIGDCIFAAFPDADGAFAAAARILALIRRRRKEGHPFNVRIGLNYLRAVRANVGAPGRREYTFIGDAVNLAQRLESNAAPGCVLIGASAYQRLKKKPAKATKRTLQVKGKAEQVVAYEVGA